MVEHRTEGPGPYSIKNIFSLLLDLRWSSSTLRFLVSSSLTISKHSEGSNYS